MSLINAKACEGAFTEKRQQPIRSTIPAGWTGCADRRSIPRWCSGSVPPGASLLTRP